MYECALCDDLFEDQNECDNHLEAYDHLIECETCTRLFRKVHSMHQHMNAVGHWKPRVPCETCSKVFLSEAAANSHMQAKAHYRFYCSSCDRHFQNENNLRMVRNQLPRSLAIHMHVRPPLTSPQHLNSRIHRGQNIECPFCHTSFVTASGVSHHLESGACPKAQHFNRETILRMARRCDPNGLITTRQIEWHDEGNVQYAATKSAFNGESWECYLCHRQFRLKRALNQHLNSPVHQQKAYHCPNRQACSKEFVSLGALFGHLESETCGFTRFANVQKVHRQLTDSIVNQKRIAF